MNRKKIILIGLGGHALSCIDVIEQTKKFKIHGYVEKSKKVENSSYQFLGTDKNLFELRKKIKYCFITIGQIKNPKPRINCFKKIKDLSFEIPIIISPYSYVSKKANIGEGSIIMHQSIINIGSKIGKNVIINSSSLIEHNVVIGDHCHISTKAVINGHCNIGNNTFIGSGAILNHNVKIGNNCIIGSGCIIKKNIKNNSLIK